MENPYLSWQLYKKILFNPLSLNVIISFSKSPERDMIIHLHNDDLYRLVILIPC